MEQIKLVIPSATHKKDVMDFRQEFLNAKEKVSGGVGLEQADHYEDWLCRKYVPHYGKVDEIVFLAFNGQNELVGISDIRLGINDFIQNFAGRIGYSVRPSQRGKGYATEILGLTLKQAAGYGLNKVLITCNEPNIASAKVIEKNGGILETIIPHPGFPDVRRYFVNIPVNI